MRAVTGGTVIGPSSAAARPGRRGRGARAPARGGVRPRRRVVQTTSRTRAIRRGVEGCQAVFHIAADYRVGMDPSKRDSMRDSNIGGTERVLDAAVDAGSTGSCTSRRSTSSATRTARRSTRLPPRWGRRLVPPMTRRYRAHLIAEERAAQGADSDRAAGLRVRPGRPRAGQPDDRAGEHRQDAPPSVPEQPQHGARRRRGRRICSPRQGKIGESYVLGRESRPGGDMIDRAAASAEKKPRA